MALAGVALFPGGITIVLLDGLALEGQTREGRRSSSILTRSCSLLSVSIHHGPVQLLDQYRIEIIERG